MGVWKKHNKPEGLKSARAELPRKEGIMLSLLALRTELAGGVSSSGRLGAPLLEQKAPALWRDQVFQTENSLGHPQRGFTHLRRVTADSLATV